jgi:DNA-binding MarR family transcriptional regulator
MSSTGERRRLPIGQLLGRLQRHFRVALYARAQEAGYTDIREAHLQVFGTIDWTGTRLTDLAARANMTRASMAELVDGLERTGYLERRPDPDDGRAKRVCLTRRGRRVMTQALRAVADIEREYASTIGTARFELMCRSLQAVLDAGSADSVRGPAVGRRASGTGGGELVYRNRALVAVDDERAADSARKRETAIEQRTRGLRCQ